jgi:hypothetical protein
LTISTAHIIIAVLIGVILKMACLTKDGSSQGQSSGVEFVSKAPSKTLIIPGKELVQVIAKVCYIIYLHLNFSSNYAMLLLFFKSISMETICY